MLEPPPLAPDLILNALTAAYGCQAVELQFLPVGNDATAWGWRAVDAAGRPYFLKLNRGYVPPARLEALAWLHANAVPEAVAPLPTQAGTYCATLDDVTLTLYPFVDGRPAMTVGLSEHQQEAFGTLLRRLHAAALPSRLDVCLPRERFVPTWQPMVERIQADVVADRLASTDPVTAEFTNFWRSRAREIRALVDRAVALGAAARARRMPFVPCHADIHLANVLVDAAGGLHVVDWDGIQLAPKERDLMHVVNHAAGPYSPGESALLAGYGSGTIDATAMAWYRYEWVVQELGDYGERILYPPDLGEATRRDALWGLHQLFDPGDVVDAAYAAAPLP